MFMFTQRKQELNTSEYSTIECIRKKTKTRIEIKRLPKTETNGFKSTHFACVHTKDSQAA